MTLFSGIFLLVGRYRRFILSLLRHKPVVGVAWRDEIWPLQWKLAVQGICGYFSYPVFNLVMFHYWGALVAGQMGMSLQVAFALQFIAQAWLQAKIPQFGIYIARHDYRELDRIWRETALQSLGFVIVAGALLWLAVYLLEANQAALSQRILGHRLIALLVMFTVFSQVVQCIAAYVRAHRKEPFLASGVLSGIANGLCIWWFGKTIGPEGAVLGVLAVMVLFTAPFVTLIWWLGRYRSNSSNSQHS